MSTLKFSRYHNVNFLNRCIQFTVVRTKGKPRSYNGASVNIAIKTPLVKPNQFSSARMHSQIGNEFIQVGWTVSQLIEICFFLYAHVTWCMNFFY